MHSDHCPYTFHRRRGSYERLVSLAGDRQHDIMLRDGLELLCIECCDPQTPLPKRFSWKQQVRAYTGTEDNPTDTRKLVHKFQRQRR